MSIRDRIHRLETRGDGFVALAQEQEKQRVQEYLQGLSDADLDLLEAYCTLEDAKQDEAKAGPLPFTTMDEMMDAVRAQMKQRTDAV